MCCVFVGCCGLAFVCLLDACACGLVVGSVVLRLCVYVACIVLLWLVKRCDMIWF